MIENLKSLGELLASKLIGQDPETREIPQPKAHDSINDIIFKTDWEAQGLPNPVDLAMGLLGGGMGSIAKVGRTAAQKSAALARKKWWQQTHLPPKELRKRPGYKSYDPNEPGQYIESGKESAESFLDDLFESFKGKEF